MKEKLIDKKSSDKILENIISSIVATANPDKIILFGSRATGKHRQDSDYDICVLKKRIRRRRKFAQKIRSKMKFLAPMDIIVNTPKRYDDIKDNPFLIYFDINNLGQVIYEK